MFREMPDPMDIVNPQILPVQTPVQAPAQAPVQPPVQTSQPTPSSPTTVPVTTSPVASQGLLGLPSTFNLFSSSNPSATGSMSGFNVSPSAVTNLMQRGDRANELTSSIFEGAERFNVGTDDFISQEQLDNINNLLGSEDYDSYLSQYTQALNSEFGEDRTGLYQDNRAVLDNLGIGNRFKVAGEYGGEKEYEFNTDTGEFDLIRDNTNSRDNAMLGTVSNAIVEQGAMFLATAGLGNALAPAIQAATGLGTAASVGVGTGIANGVSTALQGGDLGDVVTSGVTSGLGSYASGLTEAANAVDASASVIEQARIVNNISNVVDIAQAVESGNVLGAISSGLDLAGSTGIELMVDDFFYDNFGEYDFVTDNLNAISDATIAFADAQLSGDNLEETLMATMKQYIESDGGLPDIGLGGEGFDFDLGINFTRPEWLDNIPFGDFEGFGDFDTSQLRALGDYILAGASEINREVIRPVIDGVEQIARDTGTVIDQAVRDIPLTQQQIQDAERAARDFASDINENTIQPLIDTTAEVVRETGRDIREAIPDVDITNPLEGLENPFSGVDIDLPSVDLDLPSLGSGGGYSVDADLSDLAKMKTQYGDMYDFEDIMSNNLLKNQLLA